MDRVRTGRRQSRLDPLGAIKGDGSFETDGVPIGKVAIRLVNAPIELRGGRQLFGNYSTTPVARVIPRGPVIH